MKRDARADRAWWIWAVLCVVAAAALFLVPALARTGGRWPAPLDDTYIYYGCARTLALGEPLGWFPGNGPSTACTSALYPVLLAPAWALGLRGSSLGIAASAIAVAALVDLAATLRRIAGYRRVSWLFPALVVSVPLLDWSFFSGMESALLAALLGRSLLAAQRARSCPPATRARAQLLLGAWLAAAALTRPEVLPFAGALAVAAVHGAGSLATLPSLLRAAGPVAALLGLQAATSRALTGEWAQAGAVRKLLTTSPYATDPSIAIAWLENLAVVVDQAFARALGGALGLATVALAIFACGARRHRPLALACLAGVAGGLALVCLNATARYQNYRYAAPLLTLLLLAAAMGLDALVRRRRALALGLGVAALLGPVRELAPQREHFAAASGNIAEQQVEVALRLRARVPPPARVLVNDAGAIPYLSELAPIDAFGLGGFRGLPFARASVHGQPAVVELIERLPAGERPDVMALYPGWWGEIVERFGERIDGVRIEGNVICGADEKVIYAADWSALAGPGEAPEGAVDVLDVADLVSEREHDYRFPAPSDSWVVGEARVDRRFGPRYDGGRALTGADAFRVHDDVIRGAAVLALRGDGALPAIAVEVRRDGEAIFHGATGATSADAAHWVDAALSLPDVQGGDVIAMRSEMPRRIFLVWLGR
jgi:hypothetical protein